GAVDGLDDLGHREGFAGAGDAQEDLVFLPGIHAADELVDGSGLVTARLVVAAQLEFHEKRLLPARWLWVKPPLYSAAQIGDEVTQVSPPSREGRARKQPHQR